MDLVLEILDAKRCGQRLVLYPILPHIPMLPSPGFDPGDDALTFRGIPHRYGSHARRLSFAAVRNNYHQPEQIPLKTNPVVPFVAFACP